jgi:hypothetical protein
MMIDNESQEYWDFVWSRIAELYGLSHSYLLTIPTEEQRRIFLAKHRMLACHQDLIILHPLDQAVFVYLN